jgi:hypothetical protein
MVHALPRLKPGETWWDTRDGQYRCVWRGRRGIAALVFLPAWCLVFQSLYAAVWISGAFDPTLPPLAVVERAAAGVAALGTCLFFAWWLVAGVRSVGKPSLLEANGHEFLYVEPMRPRGELRLRRDQIAAIGLGQRHGFAERRWCLRIELTSRRTSRLANSARQYRLFRATSRRHIERTARWLCTVLNVPYTG